MIDGEGEEGEDSSMKQEVVGRVVGWEKCVVLQDSEGRMLGKIARSIDANFNALNASVTGSFPANCTSTSLAGEIGIAYDS